MLPSLASCWLGSYLLSPCDQVSAEVARSYSPHAHAIPASHLSAVRCLYWTNHGRGEAQRLTGCIGLPRTPGLYVLAHETGHQVSLRNGSALLERFRARFWPAGVQVGTPPTAYARTSPDEDFAESYALTLLGSMATATDRRDWLQRESKGAPMPDHHAGGTAPRAEPEGATDA